MKKDQRKMKITPQNGPEINSFWSPPRFKRSKVVACFRCSIDAQEGPSYPQKMKTFHLIPILIGLFLLAHGGPVGATIILKVKWAQLVWTSDIIFVGKATKSTSRWTANGRQIVTDTTFNVEEGIRGTAKGKKITIRNLGGSVDGIGMKVIGSPHFRTGERMVLFTEKRGENRYVLGMQQGVYGINRDPSGRDLVRARLEGLTLVEKSRAGLKPLMSSSEPSSLSLKSFIQQIQQTIKDCERESSHCTQIE
jgi:hypothetical protein